MPTLQVASSHTQYGETGKEGAACGKIGNTVAVAILVCFAYVTRTESEFV